MFDVFFFHKVDSVLLLQLTTSTLCCLMRVNAYQTERYVIRNENGCQVWFLFPPFTSKLILHNHFSATKAAKPVIKGVFMEII